MNKPAFLVWSLAFTVASGALITAVLNIDALQHALGTSIMVAVALAALVCVPISVAVSRSLMR